MLFALIAAVMLNFVSGYYFSIWFTKKLGLSEYQSWAYYKGVLFSPIPGLVAFLWFASLNAIWATVLGVVINLLIPPVVLVLIWLTKSLLDKLSNRDEEIS